MVAAILGHEAKPVSFDGELVAEDFGAEQLAALQRLHGAAGCGAGGAAASGLSYNGGEVRTNGARETKQHRGVPLNGFVWLKPVAGHSPPRSPARLAVREEYAEWYDRCRRRFG